MDWHRRRWLKILGILVVAILLAAIAASLILGRVFRNHLAEAIDKEIGAKLETSIVLYRPPWGLILYHPRITLPAPDGEPVEIFSADRVVLRLVKKPSEHEPLLIRSLSLRRPVVRLVKTPQGWLFRTATAAANASKRDEEELRASKSEAQRASDLFRLDDFSMSDARLVYRTQSDPSEQTLLNGLSAAIRPAGASKSAYACRVWGAGPTQLNTSAAIDIDDRSANIQELRWEFDLAQATQLSISGKTGNRASGRIGGNLRIEVRGEIGLADRSHDDLEGTFELKDGSAELPAWKLGVEKAAFKVRVQAKVGATTPGAGNSVASLTIQSASAVAAGLTTNLTGGVLSIGDDGHWRLDGLLGSILADRASRLESYDGKYGLLATLMERAQARGKAEFTAAASGPLRAIRTEEDLKDFHWQLIAYPRSVAFKTPKFALPLDHVGGGGTVELRDGVVDLKNLTANYGSDQYVLDRARLILFDPARGIHLADLKERVKFEEINGGILYHQPGPAYPGGFGKVMAQLHPAGAFAVDGSDYTYQSLRNEGFKSPADYHFHVSTEKGTFYLSNFQIPLTEVRGESTIAPARIDIPQISANVLGGTVVAKGTVNPKKPMQHDGSLSIADLDLEKLGKQLKLHAAKHGKMNGLAYANVSIQSAPIDSATQPVAAALRRLTADGEFEVIQADFYPIPVLEDVVPVVRRGEAKTVGDAAGIFSIANETITLKNVAVNSPALGLQSSGTIGFDKSLNLEAVATPLGDWGDKLKQSNIPIISDVAGDIVSGVQKLVNGFQGALLYKIEVTGTTDHPLVKTVPAPAITDSVALLFGKMVQPNGKPHRLLEAVNEQAKK